MQSRLLLDIVVRQSPAILQLLTREDQALLVRRNTLLVLNLGFDVVDRVGRFNLECNCFAGKSLDEDLHTSTQTKDQVQRRLLLNVVVGQRAPILQLLSCENQSLLVWGDSFLVLNLGFNVVDCV
ncbi:hypothetical protein MCOR25_011262 [Pyricularia grisea]|nr:hypothetical protein MCOR25_011262 [Pyricularia grisea]